MRKLPYVGRVSTVLMVVVVYFAWMQDWHEKFEMQVTGYEMVEGNLIPKNGLGEEGRGGLYYICLMIPYLKMWLWMAFGLLMIQWTRKWPDLRLLKPVTWMFCISMGVLVVVQMSLGYFGALKLYDLGEPNTPLAEFFKLILVVVTCLSPALLLNYVVGARKLEAYVLKTLLQPLFFCIIAFTALWLMMDLLDNLRDFQEANYSRLQILSFYGKVVPFIYVTVMPACMLLASLFALTRLSRSQELVAMLSVGVSLKVILKPFFVVTAMLVWVGWCANYQWAPKAEGNRKAIEKALNEGNKGGILAEMRLYYDSKARHVWYLGRVPYQQIYGQDFLMNTYLRVENNEGKVEKLIKADRANWLPNGEWHFFNVEESFYEGGRVREVKYYRDQKVPLIVKTEETPWQILSDALRPDYMSVPELAASIQSENIGGREEAFMTYFQQRFALPMQIFSILIIGIPFGISYSRKGAVGGAASCVFIFFIMIFFNHFFIAMGKTGKIWPWLSVWLPHLLFIGVGWYLLKLKIENRSLPKLSWRKI